jgi:hypothetical protein
MKETFKLYRAVSKLEFNDWEKYKKFRTAKNTLEAKQFFKRSEAVDDFIFHSKLQNFSPPYQLVFEIDILKECLSKIKIYEIELDRFDAITVDEDDLLEFNKCIKFVNYYGF